VAAGLDYSAVDVSEATFRDVFLPPFAAGVEAGALTLMSAFVAIVGGIPVRRLRHGVAFLFAGNCLMIAVQASGSRWLQTEVLRSELGFTGFVVVRRTEIRTRNSPVYCWLVAPAGSCTM
jgi:beta-glucosidase